MRNRLRQARLKQGVSQIELAFKTGIHYSTVSRLEKGWIRGTGTQRKKIAAFLKVKECWLFPGSPKAV